MSDAVVHDWSLTVQQRELRKLRLERGFQATVALARYVNAMRDVQVAYLQLPELSKPAQMRRNFNTLLMYAALLVEAWQLARKLKTEYAGRRSFRNGLGKLLRNKSYNRLVEEKLSKVRKKSVFHFDHTYIKEALALVRFKKTELIIGLGNYNKDVYYQIGDFPGIMLLVGLPYSEAPGVRKKFEGRFKKYLDRTSQLADTFTNYCDELLVDVWGPDATDER